MKRNFVYLFAVTCLLVFFSCQKEYSFEKGNTIPAEGSLWDSSGDCLPSTVHGTYYNGVTPGGDTAYVELQVNVTKTGGYNIKTDTANGFSFSDSGYFSSTGLNTIQLKPSGHPILVGTSTFNVSFDSTVCSFTINVQDSTGTGLGGTDTTVTGNFGDWQFTTDSGGSYKGNFAYVWFSPDSVLQGFYDLGMTGFTNDTSLVLVALLPSNQITPGTYYSHPTTATNHGDCYMGFADTTAGETIYSAIYSYPSNINFAITISSYDANTKTVKGTLSGTALIEKYYDEGKAVTIDGSFTAIVP